MVTSTSVQNPPPLPSQVPGTADAMAEQQQMDDDADAKATACNCSSLI